MDCLEIEIKAYCDDLPKCIDRAVSLGAVEAGRSFESDMYFNHPSRDFGLTDEALRIRSTGEDTILTYKGPKLSARAKTRIEKEVPVGDNGSMNAILEFLGFVLFGRVRKERIMYRLDDVLLCFDRIDDLGTFVELEKKGTEKERIEIELFDMAARLGLDRFETKSYLELLKHRHS